MKVYLNVTLEVDTNVMLERGVATDQIIDIAYGLLEWDQWFKSVKIEEKAVRWDSQEERGAAENPPTPCGCYRCDSERRESLIAQRVPAWSILPMRMYLCPQCGNKRCPRATWHEMDCTGSNEPGQAGSRFADTGGDPALMEEIRQLREERKANEARG